MRRGHRYLPWGLGLALCGLSFAGQNGHPTAPHLLRFDEVREIVASFESTESADLPPDLPREATAWDAWIRDLDLKTRRRVERGVEDSISNLILYGTSLSALPRVETLEAAVDGAGALSPLARERVHALAKALRRPRSNERVVFLHDFLLRKGQLDASLEAGLAQNLRRLVAEQRSYEEKLRAAGSSKDAGAVVSVRGTLYAKRGLSVDTSLLPNYAVEDTLRALLSKWVLARGEVRRVAVIGPGLDLVDKREGYDYYPLQSIQPFALLEAIARLGLGDAARVRVVCFDLNPLVQSHLRRIGERGRADRGARLELPRDLAADWTPQAVTYWEHFGEVLGRPVASVPVPNRLRRVLARAVLISPAYRRNLEASDLDIVAQTLDLSPDAAFDLVVATNILVYYNRFEQALAMTSIAKILSRGGLFLSNTVLPAQHPAALQYLGRRSVSYSIGGEFGDDIVVYQRR